MTADKFFLNDPDGAHCVCTECGWNGFGIELKAQKCPVCDSRVTEIALAATDLDPEDSTEQK